MILALFEVDTAANYSRDNFARGMSILSALLLSYLCYSYKFKQFKATARAIAVKTVSILVLILTSFPFILPSVERLIP